MKEILSLALLNDWATGVAVKKGITPLKVATPHQSTFVDSFPSSGSLEEIALLTLLNDVVGAESIAFLVN